MEIKLGMKKLREEHMHWEEEKLTKTLMSLIDIIPTALYTKSFNVIIDMDWLTKYHAVIVCDEKIVRIPYGNEILTIQGDKGDGRSESRLNNISCTKTQKYIQKGCHVFLARITAKKTKKKLEEKRLEDVTIMRDFLKVLPEDLPELLPTEKKKFQILLVVETLEGVG
nr:putative reverse transcriptase domain-containing protein [Tanacetum cinerariifolium]